MKINLENLSPTVLYNSELFTCTHSSVYISIHTLFIPEWESFDIFNMLIEINEVI